MPNTLITPTELTRKSLMILHQKLAFIGTIHRGYDSQFAKDGAKIGTTLNIRLPNQYTVGSGAAITPQDTTETNTSITVSTQKHVPMEFTSVEQTMSLDDFSERILDPAMSVLAASAEADAFTMTRDVYYQEGTFGTIPNTFLTYAQVNARLSNSLAPTTQRCIQLPPLDVATFVDTTKALFQDSENIAKQYREGKMGRTVGLDWYQNTLTDRWTAGNKVSGVTVSGASQTGATITLGGVAASDTIRKGTVFTFAGCNEVHPETKVDTGRLQQFVVTADVTSAGTTVAVAISPSIVTSGAGQTVSASPTNGGAATLLGAPAASTTYGISLAYQKNAFAMAFADLDMPKGVDFAAREVLDDISMRIVRQYAVLSDKKITRVDILYGFKTLRPQLACRVASK